MRCNSFTALTWLLVAIQQNGCGGDVIEERRVSAAGGSDASLNAPDTAGGSSTSAEGGGGTGGTTATAETAGAWATGGTPATGGTLASGGTDATGGSLASGAAAGSAGCVSLRLRLEAGPSCQYTVPALAPGSPGDPRPHLGVILDGVFVLMALSIAQADGSESSLMEDRSSSCADGEWYVSQTDSTGFPTQIQVCGETCEEILNDPNRDVGLEFDCLGVD